ncbi:hypothetical protein BK128_21525 [Viridibacillus sp. FSL H7-0596]|uniref:phage tail assembly chaperone n=1 Tax=Viridibacillus sp. FSL H7-0596 TaxID=1928923 RepID=UPI00096E6C2D|nr:hypothetical protein [Viridibacillus sp. FSL H7-0596]OMC81851.1 hypothetical protein BK128_21525 [Viridibacillus sp. FSL H7-0596]
MTQTTKKKITLTELIKEKEKYQVKDNEKDEIFIERLGATITVRKPERSLCIEAITMSRDNETEGEGDPYLIYNTVVEPNLKDKELRDAYGCIEPTDIVSKIFEVGEIAALAQEIMMLAGYGTNVSRVKDLKN